MNSPVRFALVGCGAISRKHLVALGRIEAAQVVAVCDHDEARARRAGEEAGLPWYTCPHQMAEKENFDVFAILTPSGSHAPLMLELAHHGRHFVVEKPLALRISDADRVIEACDERGLKLFVVKQNRFNPPMVKLKQALDAGRLGKLVMGTVRVRWCRPQSYYDAVPWRGTWAQDGGVLTNQASHHIDMLCWLMGEVESVMAMTATRLANIQAEDTGTALVRFASGAIGVIEATTATRPKDLEGSLSLLGEKGAVEVGGFFMNELKTWQFAEPAPEDETVFDQWGHTPNELAWNHSEFYRDVIASLRSGTRGLVDGIAGRKSLELITAIYESAATGQEVHLRFVPRHVRLGEAGD